LNASWYDDQATSLNDIVRRGERKDQLARIYIKDVFARHMCASTIFLLHGVIMQQRPTHQPADAQMQRISAALMDVAFPTSTTSTYRHGRYLFLWLFILGIYLEGLYLALSPLLAGNDPARDPLFQAWHTFLPWLPQWRWALWVPRQVWSNLAWFNPTTLVGNANLLLVVLSFVMCGILLAVQIARTQRNISLRSQQVCAWLIIAFGMLFALTMLVSPPHLNIFSQDMLLSWSSGRMVIIYHVNPYTVAPVVYPHDIATTLLTFYHSDATNLSLTSISTSGPVGIDIALLVSLPGQNQIANTLLSFRVMGLVLYLGNALFIWLILQRSKPEMCVPALVFYAWNPLFLLLGVAQTHQVLIVIFFVLLAIYFLQRDANVLSWFFLLLALLVNFVCLLLFPIFLRMIMRKTRFLVIGEKLLLWLTLLLLSLVVFVLAYLPYWNGWGWHGLVTNIVLIFLPSHAQNSFDSMLRALPLSQAVLNIINPIYWGEVLLGFVGLFFLFIFWLADTVDWLLLSASWLLLIFVILLPVYWPWYMLLPLALVVCSAHSKTLLLAIFLLLGALLGYYYWFRDLTWQGQAIFVLGFPCLLWGWSVFFISTWQMRRAKEAALEEAQQQIARRPRPPWLSRPSWPSRQGRIRRPIL
jgi:hypothetical protein